MRIPWTLSSYIARHFLFWFVSVAFVLFAVVMLFDVLELMRRVYRRDTDESFAVVLLMALLKGPAMLEKIVPFAALLGAALSFWRLNRHHETIVTRAAGVSIWQFLVPPIVLAILIGVVNVTLLNPLSSALLLRFEVLEAKLIRGKSNLAAVANKGLWFRRAEGPGSYILHARAISMDDIRLVDVIVFQLEEEDRFAARIDAPGAVLMDGFWRLTDATITDRSNTVSKIAVKDLPTDLTRDNINESFAPPETISFWALPDFIRVLESAGFSGVRHRLHWQSHLALPLTLAAVVLLAATFSLRPGRQHSGAFLIVAGIGVGFVFYFLSDVVHALGAATKIPVVLAAWSPVLASIFIGLALLLHLEDG